MPRRPVTSMDPWVAEQDELDRLWEQTPANERSLFPPSPGSAIPLLPVRVSHRNAPSLLDDTGLGAAVPHTEE